MLPLSISCRYLCSLNPPKLAILCDPQTPSVAPVFLPDFQETDPLQLQVPQQAQQPQASSLIENHSTTTAFVPGSPQQRHSLLQHQNTSPGIFALGFPTSPCTPDQQFQHQLLQRLQCLSGTYQNPVRPPLQQQFSLVSPTNVYQQPRLAGLYTPQQQTQISPTQLGYHVSQAPSFSSSPVLSQRSRQMTLQPNPQASNAEEPAQFIRPLSHSGSDSGGRSEEMPRLDPPPGTTKRQQENQDSGSAQTSKKEQNQLAAALSSMVSLRVSGVEDSASKRGGLTNGPPYITRSTSEKVPNRSELMSQVQRTAWARHTTK
jgi:carboxyl-terminal PDZ ligand of neuronal nitric oxide synthase protein